MIGNVDQTDRPGARTITVSAVVLTRRDGAVAVVRKRGTDRFMLAGGKAEPGETPRRCAVREIGEELGLTLDADALTYLGRYETDTANEPGFRLVSEVFSATSDAPAAPAAEIAEARWLSRCEFEALVALPEDDCAPWAPLLVRVAHEQLTAHED